MGSETPGSEGWAAYITALNAARRNVEEALRIIDDATDLKASGLRRRAAAGPPCLAPSVCGMAKKKGG